MYTYLMWEPNDSPFGEAYRHFLETGEVPPMSRMERDEFASCARGILGRPAYADDLNLARFRDALEGEDSLPERRPFNQEEFAEFCADPKNRALVERILESLD